MSAWSSFPLAIQAHLATALLQQYNVTFDPVFRQMPYDQNNAPYSPVTQLSILIFSLIYVFQFVFTVIAMGQDKSGALDALRLAGVSDFVYIGEAFLFHLGVYVLGWGGFMFVAYGFPGGTDMFRGISASLTLMFSLQGGVYSTCLAVFTCMCFS